MCFYYNKKNALIYVTNMILCSLFVGSFLMHSSSGEGAKQLFRQESFTERWGLQSQKKGVMNRFPKKLALRPTLGFRKLPRGLLWDRLCGSAKPRGVGRE